MDNGAKKYALLLLAVKTMLLNFDFLNVTFNPRTEFALLLTNEVVILFFSKTNSPSKTR